MPGQVYWAGAKKLCHYYYSLFCKGLAKITVHSEWRRTGIIESRDSILNDSLGLPSNYGESFFSEQVEADSSVIKVKLSP